MRRDRGTRNSASRVVGIIMYLVFMSALGFWTNSSTISELKQFFSLEQTLGDSIQSAERNGSDSRPKGGDTLVETKAQVDPAKEEQISLEQTLVSRTHEQEVLRSKMVAGDRGKLIMMIDQITQYQEFQKERKSLKKANKERAGLKGKDEVIAKLQKQIVELKMSHKFLLEVNAKTEPPGQIKKKEEMIAKLQKQMKQMEKKHQDEVKAMANADPPVDLLASLKEKEEMVAKLEKQLKDTEKKNKMVINAKDAPEQESPTVGAKDATKKGSSSAGQVEISLNANATIASDVASIYHLPDQSQVIVNLRAKARCPRPYFVGRLSGPALVRLDWTWSGKSNDSAAASAMTGTYAAPVVGTYFVEIMAIHCDDFSYGIEGGFKDPDATKLEGTNDANPLTFDFKPVCTEDPFNARVTSKTASIAVDFPTKKFVQGFWKKEKKVQNPTPVFTRFQPLPCFEDIQAKRNLSQVCNEVPDLKQFLDYEFEWSKSLKAVMSAQNMNQPKYTPVCYAGWSHGRRLFDAAGRVGLRNQRYTAKSNVTVDWVKAKYPGNLVDQIPFMKERNCQRLVIGTVQCPASHDGKSPTKLGRYYQALKDTIQKLNKEIPEMKIFFRSVHTNALMGTTVKCPPTDWRTPTTMHGYNEVIKHFCKEMEIPFLDATFLTAPVWDASPDYTHLDGRTSDAEVLFLTASALGVLEDGKAKP